MNFSIVIPAKNEAEGLKVLLPRLQGLGAAEIIVVNDGSTDETAMICEENGAKVINHPYSMGNGAAIKSGVREATSDQVLFMDADGQHDPSNIKALIARYKEGYDMVIGARTSMESQANVLRGFGNGIYNRFASWVVGNKVDDLTSGFRIVDRKKFIKYLSLLPNGFSYPTTITMVFFRSGYRIAFVPVTMPKRIGKSHMNIVKDGIKFLLIIFKIGTLYSPLKIFIPIAAVQFLIGLGYYGYTFLVNDRFTNMGMLFFTSSIIIFMIGLVSEQIANLYYKE